MKISILLYIKDNEEYIEYLKELFLNMEKTYNEYIFEYFIYENDSTDNTKFKLIELQNFLKKNVKLFIENKTHAPKKTGISLERGAYVIELRNTLKKYIGHMDSQYVLILDDDVYFNVSLLKNLINKMKKNVSMVTSNGIMYESLVPNNAPSEIINGHKVQGIYHYYDTLALITLNNISYKETNNTCLFKNCSRCHNKRKNKNIHINNSELLDLSTDSVEVLSAFGGCALIETNIFNKIDWSNKNSNISNQILEWPNLCRNIRRLNKKIIFSIKDKILVVRSKLNNYKLQKEKIYNVLKYML